MTFPTQEHIEAARAAADRVYGETGFYAWPSAALAQASVESAGWTKLAGKNNGFGIKATPAQIAAGKATLQRTREVINGQDKMISAYFADFDSLADAYYQHAMLFVRVKLYADGRKAVSARQFVVEIAPHYASDPRYAKTVIGIMDALNLGQYDRRNVKPAPSVPLQPSTAAKAKVQAPAVTGAVVAAGGAVAAAAQGNYAILFVGLALAAAAGGVALWRHSRELATIAGIPPANVSPPPAGANQGVVK